MFALRAHNNITFLENVLLEIEKVLTVFSIPDKIFSKTDLLMYALRAYINWTRIYISNCSEQKKTFKIYHYL